MKDANPRIFRSLEKVSGPGEFDTIVAAAVASYGALRSPNETQARDFARLVVPVWDRLLPETKRSLGAALSNSARVPREVVDRLMREPVETAAPFLVASPVLTPGDKLVLAHRRDQRFHRLADPAQPDAAPGVASETAMPPADRLPAPAPRAQAPVAPPALAETRAAPGEAAASVRETLRRMVQPGGPDAPRTSRRTIADLVAMAVHREIEPAYKAIADLTGIDAGARARVEEDETGECLAVALKALGAGPADALTVLMMLKPRIGLDTAAFDLMARYYRTLKRDDCVLLLGGRRRVQAPALQPQFEDIESSERPAPRAAFGRRSERPAQPDAKTRRA